MRVGERNDMKFPAYDLVSVNLDVVTSLCEKYHGYKGTSKVATYAWAVMEEGRPVAAYAWQPPPLGAAKSVCPIAPAGVLALSRMVAIPRGERLLHHVSTPLRRQMRVLIDRSRWPVLITYHDEGQGHTGHVYKCSGWRATKRRKVAIYEDSNGVRRSRYRGGESAIPSLRRVGYTYIQRWEHWICRPEEAALHMERNGWIHAPIPGKRWKSGHQAHKWIKVAQGEATEGNGGDDRTVPRLRGKAQKTTDGGLLRGDPSEGAPS